MLNCLDAAGFGHHPPLKPASRCLALLSLACLHGSPALAGKTLLVDNSQALVAFGLATGMAAPQLVRTDDGGTRVEWKGGVSVDLYDTRDGSFHRSQLSGDLRATSADNRPSWLQFMATQSNDLAVQGHQILVNSFQAGHAAPATQFAFGDVNADFSALGAPAWGCAACWPRPGWAKRRSAPSPAPWHPPGTPSWARRTAPSTCAT